MINIIKADYSHIDDCMALRWEMMKLLNENSEAELNETLLKNADKYFTNGDQTTMLAYDGEALVGCASICYITLMPTFAHPTGKRAHIMNVYTRESHRRQGIARRMMTMLLDEARHRGVTHVTLDSTESGRPLYMSMGFNSTDSMGIILS